jgi:type III secretory pathway component EscV
MPGGAASGFPTGVYGIAYRDRLFPGEDEYFQKNPHVAGMAAEDDKIILNPYSKLSDKEKQAVMLNEAARIHMRRGTMEAPRYELTQQQMKQFENYSKSLDDIRQTIAARILSGDPSAGQATPEQTQYVQRLRQFMGVK